MGGAARVPDLGPSLPRRGGRVSRGLARLAYRLLGWRFVGRLPDIPQAVVVVAPHTSNWDFVVGAVAMLALGLRVGWLGKHTLFRPPLARLMRWLGGIPVHRKEPSGVVEQSVASFRRHRRLLLALAPEGTRRSVSRWRTGFHHIARGAGVPIVPVALDWGRHAIVFGSPLEQSGDLQADLTALRAFYAGCTPRRPTDDDVP